MTSFPVDRKGRWNTNPGRGRDSFLTFTGSDPQVADLIEFNGLQARIGDRERIAGYRVTGSDMMFGLSAFSHADEKLSALPPILPYTRSA